MKVGMHVEVDLSTIDSTVLLEELEGRGGLESTEVKHHYHGSTLRVPVNGVELLKEVELFKESKELMVGVEVEHHTFTTEQALKFLEYKKAMENTEKENVKIHVMIVSE